MFRLKIKLNSVVQSDIELLANTEYIAGRGEDCQIKLNPEKGISRHHIKFTFDGSQWKVVRLAKFGEMLINGKSEAESVLQKNTSIVIAPYEFEYYEKEEISEVHKPSDDSKAMIPLDVSALADADTAIGSPTGAGFVKFVDRHGTQLDIFRLAPEISIAGREQSNEIVIKDQRVSRKQFKISNISGQYYIQDLGSVNGTFLNGKPISAQRSTLLKSGDQITVLDHLIVFEIRDVEFERKLAELPALQEYEEPPPEEHEPLSDPNYLPENIPQQNVGFDAYQNHAPAHFDPSQVQNYQDPNNALGFYQGDPNADQSYQQGPPPPFETASQEKTLKIFGKEIPLNQTNKMRIAIGLILFFGLAYYISEEMSGPKLPAEVKPLDPFAALKPEQQTEVKHSIVLARNLYRQANYELARAELEKVHALLPKGYEDSLELANFITEAIRTKEELEKQEQIEKDKKEAEEKLASIIAECRKLINPDITTEKIEECLQPALEINPEAQGINDLKAEVSQIEEERKRVAAEKVQYAELVAKLSALYARAEQTSKKDPLKGIDAFHAVSVSALPDPKGLKAKAKRRISEIQTDIDNKIAVSMKKSIELANAGDLKNAILIIEKAFPLDPKNMKIRETSRSLRNSLRKNMQVLYQEAVVEENIGNVETAKARWKKILTLDVPDGDYYIKSSMKLNKYGQL